MPVLPLVGSRSSRPGCNSPAASAASIIAFATRSLIEPVGFSPSSFAYMRTDGLGVSRLSSTSGVLPTSERRLSATSGLRTAAGHGREQDHGRAERNRRLDAVERAHIFAFDIDVHEGCDVIVLHDLRAQPGEAGHQVVEQLAHGAAYGRHLALAAGLYTKRRWDSNCRHACVGLPEQNST